jgi:outer membrane protein assembly factor BamA
VSVLRGAIFADVGNVWLNKANAEIPGGEFSTSRFMNELAVGIGTGFRVDLNYFVLRLDLGIPMRKPWLPDGNRWVFDEFNPASAKWRDENLVFNMAFGYPF